MKMRSQSFSAADMSCVEKTTVVPRRRISSTASRRASAFTGSSPEKGSSRISSFGFEDDRRDELHFLRHALRQRLDLLVRPLRQLQPLEPLVDERIDLRERASLQLPVVAQHAPHGHPLVQAALFGQVPDLVANLRVAVLAEDEDVALVGQQDVHDHPDRRGLAGPVRADEPVDGCLRAR